MSERLDIFTTTPIIVNEKLRFFRFGNQYEFLNSAGEKIGEAREESLGFWRKFFKLTNFKTWLPFDISLYDAQEQCVARLQRPFAIFLSRVTVLGAQNQKLGYYNQRFRFLKPRFDLYDLNNQMVASIIGDFVAWEFTVKNTSGEVIGKINKKYTGLAKELFTTVDNYVINFELDKIPDAHKKLLMTMACVIDMVFKEYGG